MQPKVVQTVQQHVSYEFIWIRRIYVYIQLNVYYCVLFCSRAGVRLRIGVWARIRVRVRIRFGVWLVSSYAHVFVLL